MSTAGSVSSGRQVQRRSTRHQHWTLAPTQQHPGAIYGEESQGARIGPRSQSLSALQPAIIQPRMARLETLEAKMASIEVSLSSNVTGRRRKGAASPGPRASSAASNKENTTTPTARHHLRTKIIPTPTPPKDPPDNNNQNEKLKRLKTEVDAKRLVIKNIRLALDRLDITDNIDVRIRQAELEYQLGREELNLLTLTEEARRLQMMEEEERTQERIRRSSQSVVSVPPSGGTLLSVLAGGRGEVFATQAQWDRSGPRFGVGLGLPGPGLPIEWCAEGLELRKGDILLEVNGKLISGGIWSRDDLTRALACRPTPADLVVLRRLKENEHIRDIHQGEMEMEVAALRHELGAVRAGAEEARRSKDGLRADNLRLTHRISYLEEQVQELLDRHGRHSPCVTSVIDLGSGQVYQKQRPSTGRSVRSLDLDADYASEPSPARHHRNTRPQPPKKPLRLSLHRRAQSLQSVDQPPDTPTPSTPVSPPPTPPAEPPVRKRTHRGEHCSQQTAIRWTTSPARTRPQGNKWC